MVLAQPDIIPQRNPDKRLFPDVHEAAGRQGMVGEGFDSWNKYNVAGWKVYFGKGMHG